MDKLKTLHIYETMSRKLSPIQAKDNKSLSFYCCGPTVYGPAHIGNFRTFVTQDLFRRVLELSGTKVKHVRNITDVDDKTIRQSQAEGKSLKEFTDSWTEKFHIDCKKLNLLVPEVEPSAVEHIPQQITIIQKLIEKKLAYLSSDNSVYYRVGAFADYGKLSHLDKREIVAGAANVAADEYAKDTVADFALWKARKEEDGDNYWESPWGLGRPGWHIECSAMSMQYLGETLDVHSGGVDLIFPHHENEIAQSEGASGKCFSEHWFHVTHLMVENQKMSKSLGNLYTLSDIEAKGFEAGDLRYVLMMAHYRKPLNFTWDSLRAAQKSRKYFGEIIANLKETAKASNLPSYRDALSFSAENLEVFEPSWQALLNDLNTPDAFGKLFTALKEVEKKKLDSLQASELLKSFYLILAALGIEPVLPEVVDVPEAIKELAKKRWDAKAEKNWALADQFRDELEVRGWILKDGVGAYEIVRK